MNIIIIFTIIIIISILSIFSVFKWYFKASDQKDANSHWLRHQKKNALARVMIKSEINKTDQLGSISSFWGRVEQGAIGGNMLFSHHNHDLHHEWSQHLTSAEQTQWCTSLLRREHCQHTSSQTIYHLCPCLSICLCIYL